MAARRSQHAAAGGRRLRAARHLTVARLALWIRCAACGATFDTGIRMDERNFARATLANNYHTCPECKARGTYHKEEYLVREDAPRRDAAPDRSDHA
jgi:hypothetical protein